MKISLARTLLVFICVNELFMKSLALFDKVLTFSHLWMVTVHVGGDSGRLIWDVDLLFQTLKRRLPLLLTLLKYLFNFH